MNENAKAWVAALRSGKWQQARSALRKVENDTFSFCCLGVASEISKTGEWVGECFQDREQSAETAKRISGKAFCDDCESEVETGLDIACNHVVKAEEFAAPLVQKWLGMVSEDGDLMLDGKRTSLALLNDAGKSFAEIADVIVANQDQLFE